MIKSILPIIFIALFISSCEKDEGTTDIYNEDLIFTRSIKINIPSYSYISGKGTQIFVRGDTSYFSPVSDTLSVEPVFAWDTVNVALLHIGIFTEEIQVSQNRIQNSNSMIWAWHSGMESGSDGYVKYSDGISVSLGEYQGSAIPLIPLNKYYWAVWAWNPSGTAIWFSSRQLTFVVEDR
ncbi:MAG: hypothetical protein JXJ22_07210 [Bacteroidales bacterium]|nr:hypothetical protein [Bacteroidales bacterium]